MLAPVASKTAKTQHETTTPGFCVAARCRTLVLVSQSHCISTGKRIAATLLTGSRPRSTGNPRWAVVWVGGMYLSVCVRVVWVGGMYLCAFAQLCVPLFPALAILSPPYISLYALATLSPLENPCAALPSSPLPPIVSLLSDYLLRCPLRLGAKCLRTKQSPFSRDLIHCHG